MPVLDNFPEFNSSKRTHPSYSPQFQRFLLTSCFLTPVIRTSSCSLISLMKRKEQTQAPLPRASQPWQRVALCCSAVPVTSSIPNVLDTNRSTSATGVLLTRISWKTLLSFQQRNSPHLLNMITNCIILTANSFALHVRRER